MPLGLIAKKLGMTQVYDPRGALRDVTVLEAGPCTVLQVKTKDGKDGYNAIQLGFGNQKQHRFTKAQLGHFAKSNIVKDGVAHGGRVIREFRDFSKEVKVGDILGPTLFEVGQWVDVIGTSKGRGFQGVMFRYKMSGGQETHGAKGWHRRVGAIGMRSFPGTVARGKRMPGHMGHVRITTQNLEVIQVREKENVLLVEGSVPGPTGGFVIVRTAKKRGTRKHDYTVHKDEKKKKGAIAKPAAAAAK
ncbi:MAG: 50S ribosomal protein L3 [Verrucomicrobia bacterium]|nr:50S ribosomal protein L3 [Verrucomicrobiota bacterium]